MNGILLLLPVFLPLVLGLLSYFLPIRSESCRRLVYSLLILGTTALAWAAILLCDDGTFTLLHFSHRLTIAFRMDGAARSVCGAVCHPCGPLPCSMALTTCATKSTCTCSGHFSRHPSASPWALPSPPT